jgi:hypothetical protein
VVPALGAVISPKESGTGQLGIGRTPLKNRFESSELVAPRRVEPTTHAVQKYKPQEWDALVDADQNYVHRVKEPITFGVAVDVAIYQ